MAKLPHSIWSDRRLALDRDRMQRKASADHPNHRNAATPGCAPSESLGRFWTTLFRAVEIRNNGFALSAHLARFADHYQARARAEQGRFAFHPAPVAEVLLRGSHHQPDADRH